MCQVSRILHSSIKNKVREGGGGSFTFPLEQILAHNTMIEIGLMVLLSRTFVESGLIANE